MVGEFDGRLNVALRMSPNALNVAELSKLGVTRISVGPRIQFIAMDTYAKEERNSWRDVQMEANVGEMTIIVDTG